MSAEYDLYLNPNYNQKEENLMHPRIVPHGTVSTDQLCHDIAHASSFTEGDVKGILIEMVNKMERYLKDGYNLEIENLGYFSVSLQSRAVKSKDEIRSASIHFKDVNFRSCKSMKCRMSGMHLERTSISSSGKSLEAEEKSRMLNEYLKTNSCISRVEYMRITGSSRNKAIDELNTLTENGRLKRYGSGKSVIYLPVQQ